MKKKILEFLSLFIAYNFFNFYTMLTIVESTSSTFYTIDNKFLISLASMLVGNNSALIVGFIIFISIYYVLKYLTGKPFLCGTIEIVLLYVLATISFVKMKILGIPLFVSDVKFLNGMEDITGLVSVSEIPEIIGIYGLALVLLSSISILILKFCSEKKKKSWKVSLVYLLILVIVFNPTVFKFFVSEPEIYIKNYYSKCGLVPFLYREFLYEQVEEPKDYSEEQVEEHFKVETEKAENWGKPNVVFLLAETFWDAEKIEEVKFDKDFLAGYKNVQQYGKTIDMISPAFAGMTTNVEFEILGGYPIRNFVEGYIAYNVLYGTEQAAILPSLVNDFNNGGYKSIIYSPFDEGEVYNVKNVYKYLGFNEINLKSSVFTEERRKGKFISDEYMYSLIPERIKDTEEPVFLFMKTVQNHMPYADKYEEKDMSISVVESELDEEKTKLVRNYVQGVYDTSIEFEKLYQEIQNIDEPTVVVFFGDHLPSLITADGKNAFLDFKWFNKDEEGHNNLFEKHHTQTVIISNYDIQMQDIKSLGFDMLGSFVLNHIDIEESPYFAFKNSRFEDYVAGYGGVYLDKNNNLLTENDLSKEQLDFMEDLKENWYYFFKDSK